VDCKDV